MRALCPTPASRRTANGSQQWRILGNAQQWLNAQCDQATQGGLPPRQEEESRHVAYDEGSVGQPRQTSVPAVSVRQEGQPIGIMSGRMGYVAGLPYAV